MMFTISAYYLQARILGPRQLYHGDGEGLSTEDHSVGTVALRYIGLLPDITLITVVLPYAALLYGSFPSIGAVTSIYPTSPLPITMKYSLRCRLASTQ
jgi:hypothetical protein